MNIKHTVVSLPVSDLSQTLEFYKNVLGFSEAHIEDGGIIAIEMTNLSLYLIEKKEFDLYSEKIDAETRLPNGSVGSIISCGLESKEQIDEILEKVKQSSGKVPYPAKQEQWGYTGYFTDPDGHLWEIVFSG